MQQYFDGPVFLNRDENHFKMATFLKASGCDRQKHTPGVKWAFDGDARDMVDEIAWVKNIISSVLFVSWRTFLSCVKRMRVWFHVFFHFSTKHTWGDKGSQFFKVMF